jgi:hypothetical protein
MPDAFQLEQNADRLLAEDGGLLLNEAQPGGAIAHVAQRANFGSSAVSAAHVVALSNPTAISVGNHLILRATASGSSTRQISSITDPRGNTWTQAGVAQNGTNFNTQIWWARVATVYQAADSLTLNSSATSNLAAVVDEFSGLPATSAFDQSAGAVDTIGTDTAFDTGLTATTSQADELLIGALGRGANDTPTITPETLSPAWQALGTAISTGTIRHVYGHYRVVSSAGTYKYAGTMSISNFDAEVIVTFKAAAAVGGANLTRTPSDTVTSSDALGRLLAAKRSTPDTVTTTDGLARIVGVRRSTPDTVSTTDAITRLLGARRSAPDTLTTADGLGRSLGVARSAPDTVTTSDATARLLAAKRSTPDTVTTTDTLGRIVGFPRALTDTVTTSESVARAGTFLRGVSESLSLTEAVGRIVGAKRTVSDAITTSEAIATGKGLIRSTVDTVSGSDAVARLAGFARTASDTTTYSDALARAGTFARTLSESLITSDTLARVSGKLRSVTDTLTTSDALGRVLSTARSVTDSLTTSDTLGRVVAFARSLTESLSIRRLSGSRLASRTSFARPAMP